MMFLNKLYTIFEYFILVAILFACIVMAIDVPLPVRDESEMNKLADKIEYYLLVIFSLEAILKIIAMGFVLHPYSYLRSIWNILDFLVVITGIVTLPDQVLSTNAVNIKSLRAVRVLRPLKLISGIPSLHVVMTSIVRAIIPLLQVLFLVVFVIIIYAIIGLEFMFERYHYSCRNTDTGKFDDPSKPCDQFYNEAYYVHGRECLDGQVCSRYVPGLNFGITSFDNIFLSMITVFQCITMEGWSDIMYHTYYVMDTGGYIWTVYYVTLIVLGSFFMLNLVLGVLSGEFAKEREKVENRREFIKLRQQKQIERVQVSYMEWISRGEEVIVEEQNEQMADLDNTVNRDLVFSQSVLVNPALIFSTLNYRLPSVAHRKSKVEQIKLKIKSLRIAVRRIIKHNIFFWSVIIMVAINTVIMATNFYKQPRWLLDIQEFAEFVFVTLFCLELLLKVFALSLSGYCQSSFNIFELIVVVLSIGEAISGWDVGLSVLRCLRLLRVFKVTKHWSTLRNLVSSLMNAMNSILSLMFLLFLYIVIAALLGMQLFAGRFETLGKYPRTNFDTFPDALLAVFQVITGEDWNTVMYNGMRAYNAPQSYEGLLASTYFLFLVIFGNYTLLNVFLAIAVDNLTNAEILTRDEQEESQQRKESRLNKTLTQNPILNSRALTFVTNIHSRVLYENKNTINASPQTNKQNGVVQTEKNNGLFHDDISIASSNNQANLSVMSPALSTSSPRKSLSSSRKSHGMFEQVVTGENSFTSKRSYPSSPQKYKMDIEKKWLKIVDSSSADIMENNNADVSQMNMLSIDVPPCNSNAPNAVNILITSDQEEISQQIQKEGILNMLKVNVSQRKKLTQTQPVVNSSSLYILSPTNRFRLACHKVVHMRYFDRFIMLVILASSITIGIENPLNDESNINSVLLKFDYFYTFIFGLEIFLKIIDRGFVLHKGAFLRNSWNNLDAFVFVCNLTSIILSQPRFSSERVLSFIKVLRVLRVLRPIKTIQRVKKLKTVFQCMVYSLKNVTFVLIITSLMLFIFACVGVQLFKGQFWYCTDKSKRTEEECQGSYYAFGNLSNVNENNPMVLTRTWKQYTFHFDNILEASLTLYACSTGEGWQNAMHRTMDATKIDNGPSLNNKPYMAIYFIVFVVIFTCLVINIFIALIILTFQRQGEKEIEGGLDRNQRDCLHFVLNAKPRERFMPKNESSISFRVWFVVDSHPFDYFIMTLIVLNTLQLMMKYDNMSMKYRSALLSLNIAFTVLFCIEATMKIIAYRFNYFKDYWNLFDLAVILGSLLDIFLTIKKWKVIDPSMFRLCRAARIIKLLRKGASIRLMLWTFLQSFKALPYVTALILLLFYMYAVIGMQLFAKIRFNKYIHEYNNFRTLIQALAVLFRCATGESWNGLMTACYDDVPCIDNVKGCGSTFMARLYFTSFIFFCMFLLLNLFVAVIMDNFEYLTRDSSILGPHHMDEFVSCWSEFDPQATGKIPHEQLYNMMCYLPPPVGFGRKCPISVGYKRLVRMNMPVNSDGSVSFYTTLLALIRIGLDVYVKGNKFDNDQELKRVIKSLWPKTAAKTLNKFMPKQQSGDDEQLTVGKIYCMKLLVMNFRRGKERNNDYVESEISSSPTVLQRINSMLPSFRRFKHQGESEYTDDPPKMSVLGRSTTFSSRDAQHEHRQARESNQQNQVRRRSSWGDFPTFFRFTKANPNEMAIKMENNNTDKQPVSHSNSVPVQPSSPHHVHKPSQQNAKARNDMTSKRYPPPVDKNMPPSRSSSGRYLRGKSQQRNAHAHSAPPTPRGFHGSPFAYRESPRGASPRRSEHLHNDHHNSPMNVIYSGHQQNGYSNKPPDHVMKKPYHQLEIKNNEPGRRDMRDNKCKFEQRRPLDNTFQQYHELQYRSNNDLLRNHYYQTNEHFKPPEDDAMYHPPYNPYQQSDNRRQAYRQIRSGSFSDCYNISVRPVEKLLNEPNKSGETVKTYSSADKELINGAPSRQYYDKMISQINNQIALASDGGNDRNYNQVLRNTLNSEDEDNEWC